jgi:sugar phosphate isomerase/epimerase
VAFDPVVIEIVCGSFVERCDCASCERAQRCFVYSATAKRQRILEALTVVLNDCKKERSSGQLAFAIELEPGVSYVVQDRDSLVDIVKSIAASSLEDAVGLNLDFAHMRAAGLSPSSLDSTLLRQVVHAHICDLPGVHTRDQEVGRWSPIYDDGTDEYFDYMRAFRFSGLMPKRILPYSGTIAVELEGCGRSKWLHNSLLAVKHLSSR